MPSPTQPTGGGNVPLLYHLESRIEAVEKSIGVAERELQIRLAAMNEFREAMRDTIQVSQVPLLEDPNVPVTQGTLPAEGFFSSLAEPLIMIGAVAVAVYLLFTVRS